MIVTPGPERSPGRAAAATAAFGAVVFVLGVVGLYLTPTEAEPPTPVLVDRLYRALQLFVLDGGALDELGPLSPVLQVARFLAPIVTVTAVLLGLRSLFANEWGRFRLSRLSDHVVICGDGPEAAALARNLLHGAGSDRATGVLVTARRAGAPAGIRVVLGDPRDPEVLHTAGVGRARAVYALADSSASSIAIAIAAGGVPRRVPGRLATYAQVRSDNLVEGLRLRRLAGGAHETATAVDFFVVADIAARSLLATHQPGDDPVVVGTGELADAVERAIERSRPRKRTVARHRDAAAADTSLRRDQEPVYVCIPDPDDAVATALRLAATPRRQVVLCLTRAAPFADALGTGGRLAVFGTLDDGWTPKAIADDTVTSRAARAIHERYRQAAIARGETPDTNSSARDWAHIEPHLRASNIAQAEHIGDKLTAKGFRLAYEPDRPPFVFTKNEIEDLAELEHDRWMAERAALGVKHGTARTATTHPDMLPWDQLDDLAKGKDRDTVRSLPDLLAGEGLYLTRPRTQ